MNGSLTPELEAIVRREVESGQYSSASEVIRDALRVWHSARPKPSGTPTLRALLRGANEQVDRGEAIPYTLELRKRLSAEARILAESGEELDPDAAL